jgi:ankyrin repeat protein
MNSEETKTECPILFWAAEAGDLDQVKRILASNPALLDRVQDQVWSLHNDALTSQDRRTALFVASQAGHLEVVQTLIAAGAKVDHENKVLASLE